MNCQTYYSCNLKTDRRKQKCPIITTTIRSITATIILIITRTAKTVRIARRTKIITTAKTAIRITARIRIRTTISKDRGWIGTSLRMSLFTFRRNFDKIFYNSSTFFTRTINKQSRYSDEKI